MKSGIALVALLWAASAVAQAPTGPPPANRPDPARVQRAPLGNIADLEPAVDVGGTPAAAPRPAPATPPATPAAPVAPAARGPARVIDRLDLGTTSITGNQELPKVLYIVPWKKSDLGDPVGRPFNSLLDEVLSPVDPEVFERQLDYYETLYEKKAEE
jgi:hypothetical protein